MEKQNELTYCKQHVNINKTEQRTERTQGLKYTERVRTNWTVSGCPAGSGLNIFLKINTLHYIELISPKFEN